MISIKDVLNRELKDNDLVLGMVVSRDSDGLRFGVVEGESVNWLHYSHIRKSVMRNVYLVENPTEKELEIKQSIIELTNEDKRKTQEELEKRKSLKRIPTKDLIVGESYKDDKGYRYVYLGKGTVYNSYSRFGKQGYIYLNGFYGKYNSETDSFQTLPDVTVLKNPKKLVELTEEKLTNYTFDKKEFTLTGTRFGISNTLTFRLEE